MKTIKNLALLMGLCAAVLLAVGCDKSESPTTPPNDLPPVTQKNELAGTKWKLVGIVDAETGKLTGLEPKDCKECYTLTFDEDICTGVTSTNFFMGVYTANSETSSFEMTTEGTEIGEVYDGYLYVDILRSVQFFSLSTNELRLYYNDGKEYLSYEPYSITKNELAGTKWECVLERFDVAITLSIDPVADLVSVSKSPKEVGVNDEYHQFRDGNLYFLRNNTLFLKKSDGGICFLPDFSFKITRLSEDEMKLEYLGIIPYDPLYINSYLFNRIIE